MMQGRGQIPPGSVPRNFLVAISTRKSPTILRTCYEEVGDVANRFGRKLRGS